MTTTKQWIAVAGIVTVLVTALVAGIALSPELEAVGVGSRAPGFTAVDVVTGDTVGLDRYEGQVVLLNIWATWCAPCEVEMPSMQRLHTELSPHGLAVVAVSIDAGSAAKVRAWAEERGLTFDILHDPTSRIERVYQTTGVPESFIVDKNGVIVKKELGAREWDRPPQTTLLRQLLGTTQPDVPASGS